MRNNRLGLTPRELAELAAFDAEVDQDDVLTMAEIAEATKRDVESHPNHQTKKNKHERERREKHRDEQRAAERTRYWNNREEHLAKTAEYYQRNKGYIQDYKKAWYRENKRRIMEKERAAQAIWSPYGQTIREARLARGLSQRALGVLLGVSGTAVGKWESGIVGFNWERLQAVLPEIGARPEGCPDVPAVKCGRPRA